jgi:hypothetical protein
MAYEKRIKISTTNNKTYIIRTTKLYKNALELAKLAFTPHSIVDFNFIISLDGTIIPIKHVVTIEDYYPLIESKDQ